MMNENIFFIIQIRNYRLQKILISDFKIIKKEAILKEGRYENQYICTTFKFY